MSDTRLAALTARVEYTDPMMRARTAIVGGLVLLGPTLLVVLKVLDAAPAASFLPVVPRSRWPMYCGSSDQPPAAGRRCGWASSMTMW